MIDLNITRLPRHASRRVRRAYAATSIEVLEGRVLLADGIAPLAGPTINGTAGVALPNVVVASFTITDPTGSPGTKWRDHIFWGDGGQDKQDIPTPGPNGSFQFLATHTYATAGTFTVTVQIAVPGSQNPDANTVTTTAVIANAKTLSSIAVTPANPSVAKGLTQQFAATGTFSDGTTADLSSQVTWASATT
jgi:hypothetical protein